jgi:acyl carrier protein
MHDTTERLIKCFSAVFPAVGLEQLEAAEPATLADWDSVATVTLMSVMEEEFHIGIDPDDFEYLLSFSDALAYLNRRLGAAATS